jgi:RNA polymerase-binding protein DksA
MSTDLKARREQLQKREKELSANLDSAEADARGAVPVDEVGDATDEAVADEERDAKYAEGSRDYEELVDVRDALKRIDAGTYGKCSVCGREIEAARLDAVPATKYCIDDARARESKVKPATL